MNCLSEETLRAYHDGEVTGEERAQMESHVASCAECRQRFEEVATTAARVQGQLGALTAAESGDQIDARAALARFKALHDDAERTSILARMFGRRWRLAWAAGAVAAILAVSLAFPSGRSLAQRLLATLRVERVQPVRLDTSSFDENRTLQQMLGQLISDKAVMIENEKMQTAASVADASQVVGFHVRLLDLQSAPQFTVTGRHSLKMTMDRARMQEILDESGRPDLLLPATIDGETLSVQMPRGVHVQYGDCPSSSDLQNGPAGSAPQKFNCTLLIESPSPEVTVPENLNLQQMAEIGLQLAGMSAVQAREFCQTVDWRSTLVLPISPFVRTYETVTVDGVQGTLMTPGNRRGPGTVLVWVKDGIIYFLASPSGSSASETLALANSLD